MLESALKDVECWAVEDLLSEAADHVTAAMESGDRARALVAVALLRRWLVEG